MEQKLEQTDTITKENRLIEMDTKSNKKNNSRNILNKKDHISIMMIIILVFVIFFSIKWLQNTTGNMTLEQLLFHLKVPLEGTNKGMVWDYIKWTSCRVGISCFFIMLMIYIFEIKVQLNLEFKRKVLFLFAKTLLLMCIICVLIVMNVAGFIKNQIITSDLIEDEYKDPREVGIVFPEQKQNLIYIYLESMENTFSSKTNGGMYEADRIPELAQIARQNINFSNNDKMGGPFNLKGTHWTIAAMVSQTSGVPLKISIGDNDYGKHTSFLPGVYTLGEILHHNGYSNYLLLGSEAEFGGRKLYFETHGNYDIWDYNSAIKEKRMTEEEKVWWGYSDNDLFGYAKEQLVEISKKDEPFNYTLLTVDTHFTDGYVCKTCDSTFGEDQYSNVIRCSSSKVNEFVEWIKAQDFYQNTTIIISGDHITMQSDIETQVNQNSYGERTTYNAFINSKAELENETKNRKFFTMDMFPTTLAALGVKIEGNRLGLGTNLFSNTQTLAEKYGVEYIREELQKRSSFYNKKFIYNEE